MKPDAQLCHDVYQEGWRAFLSGQPAPYSVCPYKDWRATTFSKGYREARDYLEKQVREAQAHTPPMTDEERMRDALENILAYVRGKDDLYANGAIRQFVEKGLGEGVSR